MRHRHDPIHRQTEAKDRFAPDCFRGSQQHGRQIEAQQHRRARPNPIRRGMPCWIEPGRQIVQRHNAGTDRNIRNGKIGTVKHIDLMACDLALKPPQPPAPLQHVLGSGSISYVMQARFKPRERLVRQQPESILGIAFRQSQGQLRRVAANSAGSFRQRSGVQCDVQSFDE